jgi:hypothetical protein
VPSQLCFSEHTSSQTPPSVVDLLINTRLPSYLLNLLNIYLFNLQHGHGVPLCLGIQPTTRRDPEFESECH